MYTWDCYFKAMSTKYSVLQVYEDSNMLRKVFELDFVPSTDTKIAINGYVFDITGVIYNLESNSYAVGLSPQITTPKYFSTLVLKFVESGWKVI